MAKTPSKERTGKTVATGISIDLELYVSIKKYALECQWSMSKAIENLSRIGLVEELKKKDLYSQNLQRKKAS